MFGDMLDLMDEDELLAEFHRAGIFLPDEPRPRPETAVERYHRLARQNMFSMLAQQTEAPRRAERSSIFGARSGPYPNLRGALGLFGGFGR